jgi:hypothetical protein
MRSPFRRAWVFVPIMCFPVQMLRILVHILLHLVFKSGEIRNKYIECAIAANVDYIIDLFDNPNPIGFSK